MNKKSLIHAAALCAALLPSVGNAGAVVGATEVTQLLNNGLLGEQVATQTQQLSQQIQMVKTQLDQYQLMYRNIQSLPERDWNHAVNTLNQLKAITQQAQGFAYIAGNAADLFKAKHPGFGKYSADGVTPKEYSEAYAGWDSDVRESITTTNDQVSQHIAGFDATGNLIEQLKHDSVTADGQKAAIQAGNQFAAVQAEQLLLLRSMMASQMKQQQVVLAAEASKQAASQAAKEKATKKSKRFFTGNEKSY